MQQWSRRATLADRPDIRSTFHVERPWERGRLPREESCSGSRWGGLSSAAGSGVPPRGALDPWDERFSKPHEGSSGALQGPEEDAFVGQAEASRTGNVGSRRIGLISRTNAPSWLRAYGVSDRFPGAVGLLESGRVRLIRDVPCPSDLPVPHVPRRIVPQDRWSPLVGPAFEKPIHGQGPGPGGAGIDEERFHRGGSRPLRTGISIVGGSDSGAVSFTTAGEAILPVGIRRASAASGK